MSKKHKRQQDYISGQAVSGSLSHEAEYRIIKFDLVKVVILNAFYLVAILALYYTNQRSQFLEHWFAWLLHF